MKSELSVLFANDDAPVKAFEAEVYPMPTISGQDLTHSQHQQWTQRNQCGKSNMLHQYSAWAAYIEFVNN